MGESRPPTSTSPLMGPSVVAGKGLRESAGHGGARGTLSCWVLLEQTLPVSPCELGEVGTQPEHAALPEDTGMRAGCHRIVESPCPYISGTHPYSHPCFHPRSHPLSHPCSSLLPSLLPFPLPYPLSSLLPSQFPSPLQSLLPFLLSSPSTPPPLLPSPLPQNHRIIVAGRDLDGWTIESNR